MTLQPGQVLLHYRLGEKIGEGGMGVVWRAEDTVLGRTVAIKFLPREMAGDADRLARFKREARVLASLNHPHVATLHGFESAEDIHFLVMELVPGETLADVIAGGPIPFRRAIPIFQAIAEGLEAAHEAGVVHRDLKPANIKITRDDAAESSRSYAGRVKILDFGLAAEGLGSAGPVSDDSPTRSLPVTREGAIFGTAAYMSPEQARGRMLDRKTDIWAFGVCLYEALTGHRPFEGADQPLLMSAILTAEPDLDALPSEVPTRLRRLLRRCLRKETRERFHDIADVRLELADIAESGPEGEHRTISTPSRSRWTLALAAMAAAATAVAAWSLISSGQSPDRPRSVRRFEIDIGKAMPLYDWSIVSEFALSPDGSQLAYVARTGEYSQLFLRKLDEIQATAVPGTEHALAPFFSPDGRWVAYYSADAVGKSNKLKKVPVDGGPPQVLCDAWPPSGGAWLADGSIVFSSTEPHRDRPVWDGSVRWGLFRVSDNGGTPHAITTADRAAHGEFTHGRPRALPDAQALLFTVRRTGGAWSQPGSAATEPDWESVATDVAILDLRTGTHEVLIENASDATYSPSGHILFMRDQALWAAPFDLSKLAVSGPQRIVRQGLQAMRLPQPNSPYALDADGSAVFLPEAEVPALGRVLVWVDRDGRSERVDLEPSVQIETPRVSPDGERILFAAGSRSSDIWVHERSRPGSQIRLTFDQTSDHWPAWFPDSLRFLYTVRHEDNSFSTRYVFETFVHRADGAGRAEPWPRSVPGIPPLSLPMVVRDDGRQVLYQEAPSKETFWDIADSSRSRAERYIVQSPGLEMAPVLSPDGRWLAYSSELSGDRQIYVRPFPDTESARWQVTITGGQQPLWSADGSELYFRQGAAMMSIPIRTDPAFRAGQPVRLFEDHFINPDQARRDYDLEYPEGRRFLMIEEFKPDVAHAKLIFVENWTEELKALVPSGKP